MSDAPQGPGWWRASDGRWYPPAPPPPGTPPAPGTTASTAAGEPSLPPPPDGAPASSGGRKPVVPVLVGCTALFVLVVIIGALAGTRDGEVNQAAATSSTTSMAESEATTTEASEPTTTTTVATTTTAAPTTTTTIDPKSLLPPMEPIVLSGAGDDAIQLPLPLETPAVARMSHQGSANFSITTQGVDGSYGDLLVNTIGAYQGSVVVNLRATDTPVGFIDVTADGPWSLTFESLQTVPTLEATPGARHDGAGDQVLFFLTDAPTRIQITCPGCGGNVAVHAYGDSIDLLVNDIGAYDATQLVAAGNIVLTVQANADFRGPQPAWSVTVL